MISFELVVVAELGGETVLAVAQLLLLALHLGNLVSQVGEIGRALLRARGLWTAFGETGWAPRPRTDRLAPKPGATPPLRDALFARAAKHHTDSAARRADYLTPPIVAKIRAASVFVFSY